MKTCIVDGCKNEKRRRYVMCRKHWDTLPNDIRLALAEADDRKEKSLRTYPSKDWLQKAANHMKVKMRNVVLPKMVNKELQPETVG